MNRIKTLCASFVLFCMMGVSVFAQGGYEVKGVVVDAIGPIIGATVIEQGTTNGASTGLDGDYVLTVSSANAVVEISCIGYATQTFVASQLPQTVTLAEDTQFLDEVVVIGYGSVKKEDMTASSASVWKGKLSEWDTATLLKAGNYKVTASYGDLEDEGFDKPYFTGEAEFTVAGSQTSEVEVSVALGNTVILVSCTDSFRNYYKDYTFSLSRSGKEIVAFAKDEARGAFVDGYKFTLEGTLSSETRTQTFTKEYSSLDEATAYTFMFDVANTGGASITITFNDSVETIELGDLELNE